MRVIRVAIYRNNKRIDSPASAVILLHMLPNLKYEFELWYRGIDVVAGVDEVGRGALAGPLVAAAVCWDPDFIKRRQSSAPITLIKDSKLLGQKARQELSDFIHKNALHIQIIEISPQEIDQCGVGEANKKALAQAGCLIPGIRHILVDHFKINSEPIPHTPVPNGDSKSLSIASASIIAKVYRDNLMRQKYHNKYPLYGFGSHVGYGTKNHREAIKQHGLCNVHRKSFVLKN